jgi:hypothetical protein
MKMNPKLFNYLIRLSATTLTPRNTKAGVKALNIGDKP